METIKKLKVGDTKFYNNAPVEIVRLDTANFALVKGLKDLHIDLNGSDFCTPCQIGGNSTHCCGEVDDIIEAVLCDLNTEDIFWVNIMHLQDKPVEYKKWEKITIENNFLKNEVDLKIEEKQGLLNDIESLQLKKEGLVTDIENKCSELANIIDQVSDAEKKKIVLADIPEIKINNSNLKISTKDLLVFITDSVEIGYHRRGGIDNWTWYGANFPKCDNVEEFFYNEALEILSSYTMKEDVLNKT